MKNLIHFFLLIVCLSRWGCKAEPVDITSLATQTESITVYDLEGLSWRKYSEQELQQAFQAPFDVTLFRELASKAKFEDKGVLWKGSSLAVLEMKNGAKQGLALSYYGGFFKIIGADGYFYFEGDDREKFDRAFIKEIIQENFIPKRRERNRMQELN
jgi:hypothetical protein